MRIAFAGGGRLGTNILNALVASRHEVVAVVQNGRQTKGWRRRVYPWIGRFVGTSVSVTGIALRERIPIVWIDRMTDAELAPLRDLGIDLLLVGGFGIILKKPLLTLPRLGCLNCHSSLLPRNRGPNPFAGAILAGDEETGITFHVMEEGIDTGDIVRQFAVPIAPSDTAASLYISTSRIAGEEVVETLDAIEQDGLHGTPQDHDAATYLPKLKPTDYWIDWSKSAVEIDRLVRALYPFEMARFRWRGRTVYLARCTAQPYEGDLPPGTICEEGVRLSIATGEGAIRIDFAYTTRPVLFTWPPVLGRPRLGDALNPDGEGPEVASP